METKKPLGNTIEHVIVVMFENRSFDNVLGGLPYADGVQKGWSNPSTNFGNIQAFEAPEPSSSDLSPNIIPYPDPREDFEDMKKQIGTDKQMKGFVTDYELALKDKKVKATKVNVSQIMQYYAPYKDAANPGYMPITTLLAQHYAVSDEYYGSGPVQTWPNRLFAHCGTPGHVGDTAYLNNKDYPNYPKLKWPPTLDPFKGQLNYKTVFEQLDEVNKSWKVYYNGSAPISGMLKYVYQNWTETFIGNVRYFDTKGRFNDFFQDIEQDSLPNYSFIEPRYQDYTGTPFVYKSPDSNHPGSANLNPLGSQTPIDIRCGENMLAKIFTHLQSNPEVFKKTLLIVTYDEHGGLFDHKSPPPAVSPFTTSITNFNYDQYGPRVPAIFINPYINPKTVLRSSDPTTPFDHTSIISTLRDQFGLKGHLTPRDEKAPTFKGLIDDTISQLNFGPTNLPELKCPKSSLIEREEMALTDEQLYEHFGSVTFAIYASMYFKQFKPKGLIHAIIRFFKRLFN